MSIPLKNVQPISSPEYNTSDILSIIDVFLTIQGEGPFSGEPAVFIRLAGCNLQCPLCDTDYTNNVKKVKPEYIKNSVDSIAAKANPQVIVITGGEPFRQNLNALIMLLLNDGYKVQLETNGTLFHDSFYEWIDYEHITIVCSPKTGSVNKKLEPFIDAYKYVLSVDSINRDDGLPDLALEHTAKPCLARPSKEFAGIIYLQPADSKDLLKNNRNLDSCIRSCLRHGYTLCIQIHKIINME